MQVAKIVTVWLKTKIDKGKRFLGASNLDTQIKQSKKKIKTNTNNIYCNENQRKSRLMLSLSLHVRSLFDIE